MKTNQKSLRISFILFLILFLQAGIVSAFEITIDVAPNVLNVKSQGTVVTVHTDIAFGVVIGSSDTLNDVAINYWKSDDRGNFVAKFKMSDIESLPLVLGEMNTFILTGTTKNGAVFRLISHHEELRDHFSIKL